jgi:fumarate reductase iron-sulfur subunit
LFEEDAWRARRALPRRPRGSQRSTSIVGFFSGAVAVTATIVADAAIECINCDVCYAACDTVRWKPAYVGPAALNRAWSLVNDERDAGNAARLRAVAGSGGCQDCHSHQSCQEYCPQALNPTRSIAGLKRRVTRAYLTGELKP